MRWLKRLIPWLIVAASLAVIVYIPDLGPEKYSDLSTMFRHERSRQANAGYSVAICKNGSIFYQESFGHDGAGQPLAKDTPMYLGPSSEILSGALLYSLTLQKRISLDDDIKTYLPELPLYGLRNIKMAPGEEDGPAPDEKEAIVTVRQLASQSISLSDRDLKNFGSRISGLEAGELDPEKYLKTRLKAGALSRSRLSYRILGTAMENAEKTSFDELLQAHILIPLGMHGTTSRPDSLRDVAIGSGLFFGLSFPYDSRVPYIAAPADGIVTTAEDIAKFLTYITAPRSKGIPSLPSSSVAGLYQPLIPGGDTGFGWRIVSRDGNRLVFQGGSVEGFSSRVVIWPERNAGIAILSAQGGVLQSNIVLPLLTSAAEKILFSGSSPRLFPLNRLMFIAGISIMVYVMSILLQTASSLSWTKTLRDRRETGRGNFYQNLILSRTAIGAAVRVGLILIAPHLIGLLIGRSVEYHDLMTMEPGGTAFFIIAMIAGVLRNIARLLWFFHLERG
ncbi:MAG TPA: serine hydrolase domain-containing protein [Rectinemataceae bacterium]|nr:serine hydrolase domain-containing protein [Rectinemataceae bacterium]